MAPRDFPAVMSLCLGVESLRRGKELRSSQLLHSRVVSLNNQTINSISCISLLSDVVVELYLEGNRISSLRPLKIMQQLQILNVKNNQIRSFAGTMPQVDASLEPLSPTATSTSCH